VSVVANVAINVDARGAAKELNKVNDAAGELNQTFGALKAAVAALGLGMAIKSIADVGNESQKSKIFLQSLTAQYGELNKATESITRIQKMLGISTIEAREGYGQLYAALRSTGVSTEQLEVLFVGLTKAARLSGAGAQETAAAMLQLKQGLASGVLQGENLTSVLEYMPALVQAMTKETDRLGLTVNGTGADLKKLGADGKLTADIVFAAAQKMAKANAPMQTASDQLATTFKELKERIAEAFGPSITSIVQKFAAALLGIGNWFKENERSISGFAKGFVAIAKAVGPIAAGIFVVVKAYQAWQAISKAVAATQAFIMALQGPKGLAMIAAAASASAIAYKTLGDISKNVSAEITKQKTEAEKAKNEFAKIASTVDGIPGKIKPATDGVKDMAAAAQKGQLAVEAQMSSLDRGASVASARLDAEKAINDLQGQQLERQYELAQTAQQRLNIATQIFGNQVRAAQIEYEQALATIELEKVKTALQKQAATYKLAEIQAAGDLAILEAKNADEEANKRKQLEKALDAQRQVVISSDEATQAQQQLAKYQSQSAEAQYQSKVLAAGIAYETKLTSDRIGMSQREASKLSGALSRGVQEAMALKNVMEGVAYNSERAANAIQIVRSGNAMPATGNAIKVHNASGGYISRPTATMVGEAGAEYIVPAAKAANFAANYLSGARGIRAISGGAKTPTINITTGPVMQQNGQNYVTMQDMEAGLRAVASAVLSNGRSYSSRRFTGVA